MNPSIHLDTFKRCGCSECQHNRDHRLTTHRGDKYTHYFSTPLFKTKGVRKNPAPLVLERALSDFYVEYELVVSLERPEDRLPVLSELHMNVQDAFNEAGVQIVSPAFEPQPEKKVIVPKSHWFPKQSEIATEPNGAEQLPNR